MIRRRLITDEEAANWNYGSGGRVRPMTEREAVEWDRAREQGDRATLLRIKRLCTYGSAKPPGRT